MIHVLLPAQYLRRPGGREDEAHRRLMAAVLQTVVDDCRGSPQGRAGHRRASPCMRSARQAAAYLASTDRSWPFSFENLCDALGVSADGLRRELLRSA